MLGEQKRDREAFELAVVIGAERHVQMTRDDAHVAGHVAKFRHPPIQAGAVGFAGLHREFDARHLTHPLAEPLLEPVDLEIEEQPLVLRATLCVRHEGARPCAHILGVLVAKRLIATRLAHGFTLVSLSLAAALAELCHVRLRNWLT